MKGPEEKARPQKIKKVDEIKEKVKQSQILILTDYRGMTVKQITDLRRELRKEDAEFVVLKNTLTSIAIKDLGIESLQKFFEGPLAVVFGYKDAVMPTKILTKFHADNEKPKIKAGLLAEKLLEDNDIAALSKLPSRKELIATVVARIKGPLYGLANVLSGVPRKLVYALEAIKNKKSEGGEK